MDYTPPPWRNFHMPIAYPSERESSWNLATGRLGDWAQDGVDRLYVSCVLKRKVSPLFRAVNLLRGKAKNTSFAVRSMHGCDCCVDSPFQDKICFEINFPLHSFANLLHLPTVSLLFPFSLTPRVLFVAKRDNDSPRRCSVRTLSLVFHSADKLPKGADPPHDPCLAFARNSLQASIHT